MCFTGLYRLVEYWLDNSSNTETCRKKPKLPPKRPNVEKTQKSSEWRHIHTVNYPTNQLLKNIEFWFLEQMREILAVHRSKTNNRQNSTMNFRNLSISILRCLEERKTYQTVQSVSKSDENGFVIAIFKKKSLRKTVSGRSENAIFQFSQIFDLESRA